MEIGFLPNGEPWTEEQWRDWYLFGQVVTDANGKRIDPSTIKADGDELA